MKFNLLKKLCAIALLAIALKASATTTSVTLGTGTASYTNVPTVLGPKGGVPANVIQFVLTSAANNQAFVTIYDAPLVYSTFTNSAYTNTSTYATNLITTWTNYYGYTNSITNIAIVDVSNFQAAATGLAYPTMYTLISPTNTATTFTVNTRFNSGIFVTNTGAASVTLSVQYTQ